MPEFIIAQSEEDYREAAALLREYEAGLGIDLCFQGFPEELESLERMYGPPGGRFLIVRQGELTAGCVALRDLGGKICEMKRLYVRPDFRGRGLGRRCAEEIVRIKRGEEPKPGPPEAELTVAGLAERFMRVYAGAHCKPVTVAKYRSILENHVLRALGSMTVGQVGAAEISALHHRLRETPRMANTVVDVLSRMFTLAEAWELTPPGSNPCRGLRRYRMRPCERFLTPEEYRRLGRVLGEAEGTMWPPAIAAIRLLVLTGCRSSEILNLRWDDVDRTAGELRLRDTKTGPRMVPMTAAALDVLDAIPRSPGIPWVIPAQKGKGRLSDLYHYWRPVRAQAGLHDVRLHDLRHSYASRALALGEGLPVIGRLLGHKEVATTARYAHLIRDAEKAAAVRVGESIGAHIVRNEDEA